VSSFPEQRLQHFPGKRPRLYMGTARAYSALSLSVQSFMKERIEQKNEQACRNRREEREIEPRQLSKKKTKKPGSLDQRVTQEPGEFTN